MLPRALAVLFDLDGTLVDSRRDIALACNFGLQAVGRPPLEEEDIVGYVGDGSRVLMARALGMAPEDAASSPVFARAFEQFNAFYASHAGHSTWMPGAKEAVEALVDRPLGLVTNKPRAAALAVLDALGVRQRFSAIVAGEDAPLKPDPGSIRAALERMPADVRAADAWMVGDGPQDILAGRAAGCVTVGVRGGFATEAALADARPDATLDSLGSLVMLVRASDGGPSRRELPT